MSWSLLLPAATVVVALIALAAGLRRIEQELVPLRLSLRRVTATAVATSELRRTTAAIAARASEVQADAGRVHRPRGRRRPDPR